MKITINKNFTADIFGFSGVAVKGNWADTGMKLMNKMWEQVKANNLKHKGINIWVYEEGDKMFAGASPTWRSTATGRPTHPNLKQNCFGAKPSQNPRLTPRVLFFGDVATRSTPLAVLTATAASIQRSSVSQRLMEAFPASRVRLPPMQRSAGIQRPYRHL